MASRYYHQYREATKGERSATDVTHEDDEGENLIIAPPRCSRTTCTATEMWSRMTGTPACSARLRLRAAAAPLHESAGLLSSRTASGRTPFQHSTTPTMCPAFAPRSSRRLRST